MSDSRCRTCRWFETSDFEDEDAPTRWDWSSGDAEPIVTPGAWGQCSFLVDAERFWDPTVPHSERAMPKDASGFQAWIIVRDDFGCVEHTPAGDNTETPPDQGP